MKIKKMLAAIAVTAIAATAFALPMSAATYPNIRIASTTTINTGANYSRFDSAKGFETIKKTETSDMTYLGTLPNGDKVYQTADGIIIAVHVERKG